LDAPADRRHKEARLHGRQPPRRPALRVPHPGPRSTRAARSCLTGRVRDPAIGSAPAVVSADPGTACALAADAEPCADIKRDLDFHAGLDADAGSDTGTYADANSHAHAHTGPDADTGAGADAHAHPDAHAHAHADPDADPDPDPDSDPNARCDADADSSADATSDTETDGR